MISYSFNLGGGGPVVIEEIPFLTLFDLTAFPNSQQLDRSVPDSSSERIPIPDGLLFGEKISTSAFVSKSCNSYLQFSMYLFR